MADVSNLGIRVDISEIRKGHQELDKLGQSAQKTGQKADQLGRKLDRFDQSANKASKTTDRLAKDIERTNKSMGRMARDLAGALGLTAAIVGLFFAVKNAIRVYAEFDQAMKNVGSVVGSSAMQMKQLSNAAREMAKTSIFTAREAANAQYYLASAGLKVTQIIDAQRGVMDLAAATQSDLASTSEAVASALSQFSLKAADATRVANVYAAAISGSQATQQKLADSMRYAGTIAGQFGQSIERTTAQLMGMYEAGLRGEQAGTTLRAAMIRLQGSTKEVRDAFDDVGVKLLDEQKKARPFIDVLRDLAEAHISAGQAAKIFGQEAVSGMLAIINNLDKIDTYEKAITGTNKAHDMAQEQMEGFENQLKLMGAAWEELRINIIKRYAPDMIKAIQGITEAINNMSGALNETDDIISIMSKMSADYATGYQKWWQKFIPTPDIRTAQTFANFFTPFVQNAAIAIKNATEESKEWGASFEDLRKALDGAVTTTGKELPDALSESAKAWASQWDLVKEVTKGEIALTKEAAQTAKKTAEEKIKSAQKLANELKRVNEQIKAGSESSLQTQLRHLDSLVAKYKSNAKIIELVEKRKQQLILVEAKKTADEITDLYDREVEAAQKLGEAAVKERDETGRKIVKINKSSLEQMLEDWRDMGKGWDDIAKNFLEGIQQAFASTFRNIFEGIGSAWENLVESMKNIFYQALAALATRGVTGILGNLFGGIFGGTSDKKGADSGTSLLGALGSFFKGGGFGDLGKWWSGLGKWGQAGIGAGLGGLGGGFLAGILGGDSGLGSLFGGLGGGLGMFFGGPLGGLLGGLGGGLLGGLFGEEEDPAIRARQHYQENLDKFKNDTYDQMTFVDLVRQAKIGRLPLDEVKAMERQLRDQGKLEWWQPSTERAYEKVGQEGYDTPEFWKKETIGGALGQMGAFGDLDIDKIFERLTPEQIDKIGEPLSNLTSGLDELGLTLEDILPDITAADIQSGAWKDQLDELTAATLIQARADKLRAEGADELTIAQQKVNDTIEALLGGFNMTDDETSNLIDTLMNSTASYEDLQKKMAEYKDIQKQLANAHNMDKDEVAKLVARGRELRKELGLGQSAFDKVGESLKTASEAILNDMIPAIRDLINTLKDRDKEKDRDETAHTGGLIMHTGGLADLAMRSGLISWHGGRFHSGTSGLLNNEVPAILQRGEFVTRANSVNMHTLPVLQEMNRTGEPPRGDGGITFAPVINVQAGDGDPDTARRMGRQLADAMVSELQKRKARGELVL